MGSDGLSLLAAADEPDVAERPAIIDQGTTITYAELAARVRTVASWLEARGVRSSSRVALRAKCEIDTIVVFFALLELGAVYVPIHPRLTAAEEHVLIEDVQPDLGLSLPIQVAGTFSEFAQRNHDPSLPLAIVYTSGTTGRPKGAVLSRGAFVASARASETNLGWRSNDRWLVCMPLAHVGGLSILTRCLLARRTIVLVPKFEPAAVLESIRRDGVTQISVVPTMLEALLEADSEGDLRRLRFLLVGGAAASPRLLDLAAERGLLAITTYGLTEACSQVTCQRVREPGTTESGSGRALPGLELRIVCEDGQPAAVGEIGYIQVRGPNLMSGYWSGPDRPLHPPFTDEKWFVTGDMGALDEEGRLFVHARRTDLIVTGGENVYPAEVEAALERCAGVLAAMVFGVPDERWGQVVAAALVLESNGEPLPRQAENAVIEASRNLAPHKRPRLVAVVLELAKNRAGKIDRAAIMQEATPLLQIVPSKSGPIHSQANVT